METSGGGWTVIQRRIFKSDFYRTWDQYASGFGNLETNFWLGNDNIHSITSQGKYELRVDLEDYNGDTAYANYGFFFVDDAKSKYILHVSDYIGTAGDSFTANGNGKKFSTFDKDNDIHSKSNCAQNYHGAWWYSACHTSNLNGDYGNMKTAMGPVWQPWKGYNSPMKKTEMKIRRV
jgi:hypothetical protein